jgi:hypothetical protein
MSNITILWHEKESDGYIDILPAEWFVKVGERRGCLHEVKGPRDGSHRAKCDLNVEHTCVDLDYSAHEKFNSDHGMFLGVMRICFEGSSRERVSQVFWRHHQKKRFQPCSVTVQIEMKQVLSELELFELNALAGIEGRERLVSHWKRERCPKLVAAKKTLVLAKTGKLACEACGFVFSAKYGDLGEGFCEVHHRIALSSTDRTTVMLDDLAVLCSNCHQMLHRTGEPMLSVEEFAKRYLTAQFD